MTPACERRRAWLRMALAAAVPLALGGLQASPRRPGPSRTAAAAPPDDVCIVAPTLAWEAGSGVGMLAPRAVPAEARCPVCGTFPARRPGWAAQALYADGHAHFLASPRSLFLYLHQVERFAPGRRRTDIAALYVNEHGTDRWLAAEEAVYVHGSSVPGPHGNADLPAVAEGDAANRFIARHGGQALGFAALERQLPEDLRMPARSKGMAH